jgi:hypothetical protein
MIRMAFMMGSRRLMHLASVHLARTSSASIVRWIFMAHEETTCKASQLGFPVVTGDRLVGLLL